MEGAFQLLILLLALISILASALRKYRQAESRRLRPEPSVPPEAYEEESIPPSAVPREKRVPPPLPPLLQRLREEMERMAPPPVPVEEEKVRERPPVEKPPPEERQPPPAVPETVWRIPPRRIRRLFGRLTSDAVVRGIVLAEILGPCRAQRPYDLSEPGG